MLKKLPGWLPTVGILTIAVAGPFLFLAFALLLADGQAGRQSLLKLVLDPLAGGLALAVYGTAMTFGIGAAFRALQHQERERQVLNFANGKCTHFERNPQLAFNEKNNDFVEPARSGQRTAVRRMVDQIWSGARGMRFEPVSAVLAGYTSDILSGSRTVKAWQTAGIRLGILGTFIGLILALVPVAQLFSAGKAGVSEGAAALAINDILRGLSLKFGTSIAGLTSALLLQAQASLIRAREDALLRDMEALIGRLQHTMAATIKDTQISLSLANLEGSLHKHNDILGRLQTDVQAATVELIAVVKEQSNQLAEERAKIAQAAQQSQQHVDALAESYRALDEMKRQFTAALAGSYRDALDPKVQGLLDQAAQSLMNSSLHHARIFDQRIQDYLAQLQSMPLGRAPELATALTGLQRLVARSQRRGSLLIVVGALSTLLLVVIAIGLVASVMVLHDPDLRTRVAAWLTEK